MYRLYLGRVGRSLRQIRRPVLVQKADIPLRRISCVQNPRRQLCECEGPGLWLCTFPRAMSSSAAGGAAPGGGNVNRLAMEKSPYLLQHATNPVDWYPWGQEAFTKAKKEDKLIFLSVGYSTCHWCHVMERESFESEEIGKIMSDHFVNIKVDREERPDVDKIYMSFVHATTGGGGWPMSVWMTPDLKPIVGGTYFPPDNKYYERPGFKSILLGIAQKWKEERDKMDEQGTIVVDALMRASTSHSASRDQVQNIKCIERCFTMLRSHYDEDHGGIGTKPKFPQPANFNFLLRHYADSPDGLENQVSLKMVTDTLQSMAKGGIHDHVNKGFHRYSTDQLWHVPHFEKMLYDQAQLAVLYAETFQVTADALFAGVTRDILEYVSRDLTDPNGGFYSAEDADSLPTVDSAEKKEGAFCVWTSEQLDEQLSMQVKGHEQLTLSDVFQHHYGAKKLGNVDPYQDPHDELKGQNVLIVKGSVEETSQRFCLTPGETIATLETCRQILFEERKKRPPPHLDNKMITAWNGLMISGFAKAGQILDDQNFKARATKAAHFIKAHMYNAETKTLLRSAYVGAADSVSQIQSPIPGFADDYAFLVRGLLDLYEAGQEEEQLAWAEQLQETQNELFWDADSGGYFNTAQGDPSIIMRLKEDHDGAEPSANSVSASNLLRLSYMLDRPDWRHLAVDVLAAFAERLEKVPAMLPEMVAAHMMLQDSPKQIIIAGDRGAEDTRALLRCVHSHFLPNKVLLLADGDPGGFLHGRLKVLPTLERLEGKATAYMCENYSCSLPVNSVDELEELLKE